MTAAERQKTNISGVVIETRLIAASTPEAPVLVFLHEGLGCVELWRDFPDELCAATGCGGLIYSREGYGDSDPCDLPRPLDYMQTEAASSLPKILSHFDIRHFVLVGHSDGASIALAYAGLNSVDAPRAVIAMAPHIICEDISVRGIEAAKQAYEQGDLKEKLFKFHGMNTDCAFYGWNNAWLDPAFRTWTIAEYLTGIKAPVLAIQGLDDEYGTTAQIDMIEEAVSGSFEKHLLENCGHSPWLQHRQKVLDLIVRFIDKL